jgi:hypothetical protein
MLARVLASKWKGGRMLLLIKSVGSLLAMVMAVLAYTFWPEQAQVFGRPTAEVRNLLKEVGLPPHVFGSEPKTFKVLTPSPERMVWSIAEQGNEEMLRYVVTLTAEGARATRVRVDVTRPNGAPLGPVTANALQRRTVRNIYTVAMREQIAAALERRDFESYKIMFPTAIAVLVNMTALSNWLSPN